MVPQKRNQMTEEKNNMRYDERSKMLFNLQQNTMNVYGDEKYGSVKRTDNIILTEEGVIKAVNQMEADKKQIEQDIDKQKDIIKGAEKQKKFDEESVEKLKKEIHMIKKAVGNRINFNKNNEKAKLAGKDKKEQGTGESDKTKQ